MDAFLYRKSRKEFEDMAQTDEHIGEAYEALKRLSADEKKRPEYEAREKTLRDYNSQIYSAEKRGRAEGVKLAVSVFGLHGRSIPDEEIACQCNVSKEEVQEILALWNKRR